MELAIRVVRILRQVERKTIKFQEWPVTAGAINILDLTKRCGSLHFNPLDVS